jgi:hypothetical protein
MDWLTFFSTNIKAVAWPITIIVVLVLLRTELRAAVSNLARRLQSFKGFGFETTFGEVLDQTEQALPTPEVQQITASASFAGSGGLEGDAAARRIETISTLAQLPPPYIVSQSWLRLEQAIREVHDKKYADSGQGPRRRLDYVRAARAEGLLNDEEMYAVQRLREMRNLAAHSLDPPITMTDALRYQDMVEALITTIKQRGAAPKPQEPGR